MHVLRWRLEERPCCSTRSSPAMSWPRPSTSRQVPADYILISHGHFDHLADAADIARRTGATIISNFEITTWFGKQGLEKPIRSTTAASCSFEFGRVKLVNAIHSSSLPDGTYGGNPGGFVVESAGRQFLLLRRHGADVST